MAGVKQLIKQPVDNTGAFDFSTWSPGTTSITAVEHTPTTVTWAELVAAGFAAGDDVMIMVSGKLGSTNVSGIARCQVGFGSTFTGRVSEANSLNSIEVAVTQTANATGHTFFWLVRRTLVANENIYLAKWSNSASYTCHVDASVQVIRLGDMATNNYAYGTATHTGNAPTAYGTTGASITLPQAGDWIIWGEGYWLDDSTTANATQALLVGATNYAEIRRQGENVENSWSLGNVYYGTIASGTVCRVQFKVGTANTHDCIESKIFALRLDQFAFHRGAYTTTATTLSSTSTEYTVYNNTTSYTLPYGMPVQMVAAPIFTVTDATKSPRAGAELILSTSGAAITPLYTVAYTANGTTDKIQPVDTAVITPAMWSSIWSTYPGDTTITFKGLVRAGTDISPTFTCSAQCFVFWTWDFTPLPVALAMPSIAAGAIGGGVVGHIFAPGSLGDTSAFGNSTVAYARMLTLPSIAPPAQSSVGSLSLTANVAINTRQGILQDGRSGRITYHEPGLLQARNVKQIDLPGRRWSIELSGDATTYTIDTPPTIVGVYQPPSYDPYAVQYDTLLYTIPLGFSNATTSDPQFFAIGFKNAVLTSVDGQLGIEYRQDISAHLPTLMQLGMVYDQLSVQLKQYALGQAYTQNAFTLNSYTLGQSWHRGVSLWSWQIDQAYSEYSYTVQNSALGQAYDLLTIQLNQYAIAQSWLQDTVTVRELPLNSTYDFLAHTVQVVPLGQEWKKSFTLYETTAFDNYYDLLTDQGPPHIELQMGWQQHSSLWITEILAHVNAERLAANRTHQIKHFDNLDFGVDIANQHSLNMVLAHTFAHESLNYPIYWRTLDERKVFVIGASAASENLQFYEAYSLEDIDITGVPPQVVHDGWHDSPPHYANYMHEWSAGADVYMLIGIQYFPTITTPPGFDTAPYTFVITQVFVNLGRPENLMLYKSELTIDYQQTGAFIETYEFSWAQDAYKHVAARHVTTYAIHVSAQHEGPFSYRVAAQHTAPQYYGVSGHHIAAYEPMVFARGGHVAPYDVREYASVKAQHSSPFGLRVGSALSMDYSASAIVSVAHTATYERYGRALAQHGSPYARMSPVAAQHVAASLFLARPVAAHIAGYADEVRVRTQKEDSYDILTHNLVRASMVSTYILLSDSAGYAGPDAWEGAAAELIDVGNSVTVTHLGVSIEHEDVDISTSEDEFVWTASITLSSVEDYVRITVRDAFEVTLGGVVFAFIVTDKTLNRDDPANISMAITGRSPAIRFTEPIADTISHTQDTPIMASVLATQLLEGTPVVWDIVDWQIPALYFAVENVEPIAAVQLIAEAAGGLIESLPDGTLRARYKFPVSVTTYGVLPSDTYLSDAEDNLSYGESIATTEVFTKYRIRNGSGDTSDSLEYTEDEGVYESGVLRAYLKPWRDAVITHTGGATVSMGTPYIETRTETEQVEFVDGSASLKYPGVTISTVVWKSDPLGGIILDARTTDIKALDRTINYGYGVAEITYVVECVACKVQCPVGNVAQFILTDK